MELTGRFVLAYLMARRAVQKGHNKKGLMTFSHKPLKYMVGRAWIEPATLCLEGMSAEQVAEAAVNRRVGHAARWSCLQE